MLSEEILHPSGISQNHYLPHEHLILTNHYFKQTVLRITSERNEKKLGNWKRNCPQTERSNTLANSSVYYPYILLHC